MAMSKERKAEIIKEFQKDKNDVGSTEVQVALLTEEINNLTEHFKTHIHDYHSKRVLQKMVGKRKKLLNYLKENDVVAYRELIKKLADVPTALYVFSYGKVDKEAYKELGKNIRVEDIPEPLSERAQKRLNKDEPSTLWMAHCFVWSVLR